MGSDWAVRRVPLKFGIGDWTPLSVHLRLHCRTVPLAGRPAPVSDPMPPQDRPCGDASGYMIRALPVARRLPEISRAGGYLRYVLQQYRHCSIDLSIGLDAYRAGLSAKTRSTLARKVRKFEQHCGGRLDWRTYSQPSEMVEFHRLAREVSSKTYQERLLDAGIPDGEAFVDCMKALAAQDAVRGWLLFHADRPVSYLYCPADQGVLTYAFLGYDPAYMKHSVGTVLQWLAIEQLYASRRFSAFDFTEGESDHKRLFATDEVECANLVFVRDRPLLSATIRGHALVDRTSGRLGDLAERWGIKSHLKRMLRFGHRGPVG